MERKSFIVYLDLLDSLDELNDAQAGKLFKTIKAYHMSKAEGASQECVTNFEGLLKDFVNRLAFAPFRAAFERDAEKYRDKCCQMKENGKKGGRPRTKTEWLNKNQTKPKGFSENQKVLKKADNDNEYDIDNDNAVVAPLPPQGEAAAAAKLKRDVEFQKTQVIWKAGICMKFHIDELRVNDYLDEFYTDMLCRGYHVTNVPSLFTSWLSDRLNQSKNQARNETAKTLKDDRLSERRGTEPSSEDRKGFKGTFQHRD